jgi:hypothetical protein
MDVAPQIGRPKEFWADEISHNVGLTSPITLHVGHVRSIDPVVIFAGAADNPVYLRKDAMFRAIQDPRAPVIDLRPDGSFTALREGTAEIQVALAGYTSSTEVAVNGSAPVLIGR